MSAVKQDTFSDIDTLATDRRQQIQAAVPGTVSLKWSVERARSFSQLKIPTQCNRPVRIGPKYLIYQSFYVSRKDMVDATSAIHFG